MKFAVVLCALVACAAAVPQERGLIEDKVRNIVNDAIDKAQSDIANVKADILSLTSSFEGKVSSLVSSAKNQIASLTAQAEATVSAVIAKGGSAAACAQTTYTELTTLKFSQSTENCIVSIAQFEADAIAQIAELTASIAELVEIVEECTTDIFEAVVCAVTKVRTVEDLISEIVGSVKDAIAFAEGKSTVTITDIETCTKQVVSEATTGVNNIVNTVKSCA